MAILLSLLAIAVITDILYYKIPNLLIMTGLVIGYAYRYQMEGGKGVIDALFCTVIIFLFLFPFYLMHGIGAGDIKLFCMTAIYLPLQKSGQCLMMAMMIAAGMSVCKMLVQRTFGVRMLRIKNYLEVLFFTGKLRAYGTKEEMKNHKNVIRLSIPVFLSVLLSNM